MPFCTSNESPSMNKPAGKKTLNPFAVNRRAFLANYCGGIGGLALAHLLQREAVAAGGQRKDPLASGPPHKPSQAKSVICLFQHGGPSQMDLFDAKPELLRHSGEPYPGKVEVHFAHASTNLLGSPFKFKKRGECGMELSELLPHTGAVADELTLVRSMTTTSAA